MKRMTLKMMAEDFGKTALNLGRADENKAVRIEIDLSNLLEITPDANASVTVETPSGKKYPATTSKEGKLLIWDVNSADTAEEGRGWAQLTITGSNDEVLKSVVTATRVWRSIRGEGTAPDPVQNWVDDATSKLGNVVSAGENAKEAAKKAEEAAKRANDAAEKAENGGGVQSDYAQNDETQMDYIKNRPGGYYQTVQGVNITWDGVIGDRPNAQLDEGVYWVKVGDEVLTAEQVIGAKMTSVVGGEAQAVTVTSGDVVDTGEYIFVSTRLSIGIVSTSVLQADGVTFPETGTYFVNVSVDEQTFYISSLQSAERRALVPIPGELTNIKGGYDLPAISNQPVYSGTVPASTFSAATQAAKIAVAAVIEKNYGAPITLTNPLAEGATVSGTVNGTAVSGVVEVDPIYGLVAPLYTGSSPAKVAVQTAIDRELVCDLTSDSVQVKNNPPETDLVLALTQSRATTPKVIPAEYLDVDLNAVQNQINEMQMAMNNVPAKTNPVFSGSFSQNRKAGTTIGGASHVEGLDCTASGLRSHAEGHSCQATNQDAHAEGNVCTASGVRSHAEGMGCIAAGKDQHAQGRNNIEDDASKYAHIVGNGLSYSNRSNAHTLDWKGVPWFKGRPQFGGTAQDDGSQTVIANGDKDIILASSTAGSTKKFKITVDDAGTLSATEVMS